MVFSADGLCSRCSGHLSWTFKLSGFTAIPKLLIRPLARPARVPRGFAVVPYLEEEETASFAGPGHDLLTRESEMMLDEVLTDYSNFDNPRREGA